MTLIRTAAVAALSLLALSGCGSAAEPAAPADAAPTAASSTAPASNISEPASNDLAAEESAEGARAFLFHYFDLKSYALQTGRTAALLEKLDGAQTEAAWAEGTAKVYDDGGWILGGQPKVKNVLVTSAEDAAPAGGITALIPVNPGAYTSFGPDGDVLEHRPFAAGGTVYSATVMYADGAWKLTSLEETPEAELPE